MTGSVGDASTRLIVIRGNSGSGKSTLAAAIRKSRPRGIAIVIVEGILQAEIYGQMVRQLLADHRGVNRCYRYELPFEETVRRHATKGMKAQEFGPSEMRSWWRDRDPLHGVDEKTIGQDSELPGTLRTVLTDCDWTQASK